VRDQSTRCTWRRGDSVHLVSKEIPNGGQVRIRLVLWPGQGHALSVGISLREVGVDERWTPECLTQTTTIAIYLTVRGEGGGRERRERDDKEVLFSIIVAIASILISKIRLLPQQA
jgi:hypothetical protein